MSSSSSIVLPVCAKPRAFADFKRIYEEAPCPDTLLGYACAVAEHFDPSVDFFRVDSDIQAIADEVRTRILNSKMPMKRVCALNEYFFETLGFGQSRDCFQNISSQLISKALETKSGAPVIICIVYQEVARRLGIRVNGLNAPGHFLVRVHAGSETMILDPFYGGKLVTREEIEDRAAMIFGQNVELPEEVFKPAAAKSEITRVLQNSLNASGAVENFLDVAAMIEFEMVLWPEEIGLVRDLGLVLARVGMPKPATKLLSEFLMECPDDPQRHDLEQLIKVLEEDNK